MKNRIATLFQTKKNILNIYYTAGFPQLENTLEIAEALQNAGVDILEIGIPFSDPLADGPIIQNSSQQALKNGMSLAILLKQLQSLRKKITIPVLLMGYFNPILQMGVKEFCFQCQKIGIDGVIIPDLPVLEYNQSYHAIFQEHNLCNIFLITPETSLERMHLLDKSAEGFLYIVSSSSTTGTKKNFSKQEEYFEKIKLAKLKNPSLIGFNIRDKETFSRACKYARGGIIGSAFIEVLQQEKESKFFNLASNFVKKIKG